MYVCIMHNMYNVSAYVYIYIYIQREKEIIKCTSSSEYSFSVHKINDIYGIPTILYLYVYTTGMYYVSEKYRRHLKLVIL